MNTTDFPGIVDRLAPGATVTGCEPLTGGVSAEVHLVTFLLPDGTEDRAVVRRHRTIDGKPERAARAAREYDLLTVLHAGGLPVARPRLFVPPDTLVQDLIDGDTRLPADAAVPLARTLAAIHATSTTTLPPLPSRDDPLPELGTWLPGLALPDWKRALFRSPPRLLHGDYWPGNILWHRGRLAAVLDWEDAALGDPLSDVACARVELTCAAGAPFAATFTGAYLAATNIDTTHLPWWDLYVATAALEYMDGWGLDPESLARRRAATTNCQQQALAALGL